MSRWWIIIILVICWPSRAEAKGVSNPLLICLILHQNWIWCIQLTRCVVVRKSPLSPFLKKFFTKKCPLYRWELHNEYLWDFAPLSPFERLSHLAPLCRLLKLVCIKPLLKKKELSQREPGVFVKRSILQKKQGLKGKVGLPCYTQALSWEVPAVMKQMTELTKDTEESLISFFSSQPPGTWYGLQIYLADSFCIFCAMLWWMSVL